MPLEVSHYKSKTFCKVWLYMYVLNDNAYSVTEENGSSRVGWYLVLGSIQYQY